MKKISNISLMLKQGVKGVFKFKAQFIIIIILAFIATLVLSVSLSTQRRLQDSYDKIVEPVKRFDYSGSIKVFSQVESTNDPYLAANLLDGTDATSITVSDNDKTIKSKNGFNFVLNNFDSKDLVESELTSYGLPSFITDSTNEFIKDADSTKPFINSDAGNLLYANILRNNLFKELKIIADFGKNNDYESFRNLNNQLKYSPIGVYTFKNPHWFDGLVKFDDKGIPSEFLFTHEYSKNNSLLATVLFSSSSIAGFCNNVVTSYNSDPINSNNIIDSNAKAIAFLFGVKKNDVNVPENWIVKGNDSKYSLNVNLKQSVKADAVMAQLDGTEKNNDQVIWKNGLRGITNPIIEFKNNVNNDYSLVNNWDNFEGENLNDKGRATFYYWINDVYDFYWGDLDQDWLNSIANGWAGPDNSLFSTIFRSNNMVAAGAAGFDYGIRREVTYFDSKSQIKFRIIVLDGSEDYNVTYLEGRRPAYSGEVSVNEQFAKKNRIHVGSKIKIGNTYPVVSGISTDAFSYMPSQDIQNPIPNPKMSAFIFARANEVRNVFLDTADHGTNSDIDHNYAYFLWNKDNEETIAGRKKAVDAFYSNETGELKNNQIAIKQFVDNGSVSGETGSEVSYTDFDHSPYKYSWTVQPTVMAIYDSVVFIAAAVIAFVAIVAIVIGVKKTVDYNSKQIGILKALGTKSAIISISYISYSLIIGFIAVPCAWLIGLALQIPFGQMFVNYFSMIPNAFIWDWISIVIAVVVLGILSGAIAFGSAYILTRRPILKILDSSVKWGNLSLIDWLKNHTFKKANFSTRFSLTLTSSGSKQIVLLSVVMLIASFLISICLAIPAIIVKVNSSYYGSINYANKYDEIPMIGNAPLSKNAITYWNGQDYADSQYVDAKLKLDDTASRYGYFKDNSIYSSTVQNSSVISPYLYNGKDGKISDSYVYILSHIDDVLSILGGMFGDNFYTTLGTGFSIGMVDKLYGAVFHSIDNLIGQKGVVEKDKNTDKDKLTYANNLSRILTTSIPKIVSVIISQGGGGTSEATGSTWKEKILSALNQQLPSYVKGYVQRSESRQDLYGITYQNEIYIPGEETLTTNVISDPLNINGKTQNITLTGLDKNQSSISLTQNDKEKLFLPDSIKSQIMDLLNPSTSSQGKQKDIIYKDKNFKVYDAKTNTLNIPVIPNKQAESAFDLSSGNSLKNWKNKISYIQFKDAANKLINLPRNAWVYDDTDFDKFLSTSQAESIGYTAKKAPYELNNELKYDSNNPNKVWNYDYSSDGHVYLDPSNIDNGKLSYNDAFADDGTLKDRAYMFKDFTFGNDGKPNGTYLRPYYQYKNVKLMVPEGWLSSKEKFLWNDGTKHTFDGKATTDWYSEINYEDVPSSVSDAYQKMSINDSLLNWDSAKNNKWLVVNPYDINYYQDDYVNKGKSPLTNLTDGPAYWYRYVFEGDKQLSVNSSENVSDYLLSLGAPKGININLASAGSINSYNDKLIVTDSDLANILSGYPNSRAYQYNYQIFNKNKEYIPPTDDADEIAKGKGSQFDRWYTYSEDDLTNSKFATNLWSSDPSSEKNDVWQPSWYKLDDNVLNYAPHNFYNGKLSNISEPLNLTSVISETMSVRVGQYATNLGHSVNGYPLSSIEQSELLSTVRALTNQIVGLAITIGALLVAAIVITSALLTMLAGDIYISQYKRFMVLLRALGYSNMKISVFTFGTVSVMSFAAWLLGTILAWLAVFTAVEIMWNSGFAIPVGIDWWPILLSLLILAISYVGSLYVSSSKARKHNPSLVLTATAE